MDLKKDPEKLTQKIADLSKKSKEEVQSLIQAKKDKFSGLLTDSGATFMVAKELGVELENSTEEETTKISSLKEGMNNIDVIARIKQIFQPREFDKNGRKGKLQNVILKDDTGEISATFWNKDVDKLTEQGIGRESCLKLSNCSVTSYNEKIQLNMAYNSSFALEECGEIPVAGRETKSISDLDSGMNDVSVNVIVKRVFPPKEFENDRGGGKVMNFIVGEGVNEMRATAWNEMCEEVENYSEGDKIRIDGAYTKEGRDGVELHLGWSTKVAPEKD